MSKHIIFFLAMAFLVLALIPHPVTTPMPTPLELVSGATLAVTGDIIPHQAQIDLARQADGSYDFTPSFRFVSPLLHSADLAVGNLETPMAGRAAGFGGYPRFNAPQELAAALKKAGFHLFTTANNHMLDQGKQGLLKTITTLEDFNFLNVGTAAEAPNQPLLVEVNGITMAFVAWTTITNNPVPNSYLLNYTPLYQPDPILEDIQRAKEAADLTILLIHWGQEYQTQPDNEQRRLAKLFAQAGADMILGSHPHVPQPLEWIVTPERTTLVAYSLSNFWSNQHVPLVPTHLTQYGITLQIRLIKDIIGNVAIAHVDYEITWVHRADGHRIIPLTLLFEQPPENFNIPLEYVNPLANRHRQITEIVESLGFRPGGPPKHPAP